MNTLGEISRKVSIREDLWIKQFTKYRQIKVARSNKEAQLRDLPADMHGLADFSV
jgi:hypothetical protein